MSDPRLRKLERAAAQGDPQALRQLRQAQARSGQLPWFLADSKPMLVERHRDGSLSRKIVTMSTTVAPKEPAFPRGIPRRVNVVRATEHFIPNGQVVLLEMFVWCLGSRFEKVAGFHVPVHVTADHLGKGDGRGLVGGKLWRPRHSGGRSRYSKKPDDKAAEHLEQGGARYLAWNWLASAFKPPHGGSGAYCLWLGNETVVSASHKVNQWVHSYEEALPMLQEAHEKSSPEEKRRIEALDDQGWRYRELNNSYLSWLKRTFSWETMYPKRPTPPIPHDNGGSFPVEFLCWIRKVLHEQALSNEFGTFGASFLGFASFNIGRRRLHEALQRGWGA